MKESIGIDAHKSSCTAKLLDVTGSVKDSWQFPATRDGILQFLERAPANVPVAIEASTTGKAVAKVLKEHDIEVHMGAPAKIAMIAKVDTKTDAKDSETLAHLLQAGYFPECYIPPLEIEELRNMVRNRMQIGKKVSAVKNQVHALIARNLLTEEFKQYSDIFGIEGMEKLSQIELPPVERKILGRYMMELKVLLEQEEEIRREMAKIGENNEDVKVLMTIPGIDYYTAIALIAEIGDIKRFPTKRHLASYAGLVPKVRNSGETVRSHLGVKKGDMVLKYFFTSAVQGMLKARKHTAIKTFYRKKVKQIGVQKALVAAARKLSWVVWWVLTNKKPYKEEDIRLTTKKYRRMKMNAKTSPGEMSRDELRTLVKEIITKHDVLEQLEREVIGDKR